MNKFSHRIRFFFFLKLTLILTFFGSLAYAGLELDKEVLDSIKSEKNTPDLRKFSDEKMKQIFRHIAENNENTDAKPFIERVRDYKNNTSVNNDKALDYIGRTRYKDIDIITNLLDEFCSEYISKYTTGRPEYGRSEFNNLITTASYLGNKVNQNKEVPPERKQEIFENIGNMALKIYSTILNQNPMSLKRALAQKVRLDNSKFLED